MRTHTLITHLRAEDAYTLIEFMDQMRDILLQAYGDEIAKMMQEGSQEKTQLMESDAPPF